MPTYSFQMSARVAGSSVSVTAVGSSTVVASGTLDANSLFTASLPVGDYVATAAGGHYSYRSAGTVVQPDADQLADLDSTFTRLPDGLKNFKNASFENWRAALARSRSGGAIARLSIYGDSQTNGYQSANGSTYSRSYGYRAMQLLDKGWETTKRGIIFPRTSKTGTYQNNPEFTLGAGWTPFIGNDQGIISVGSVSAPFNAAGALTLTAASVDTFVVYAAQYSGAATLNVSIDGGAPVTVNLTSATKALVPITATHGTVGTHTVSVTSSGTAGTNYVIGIEAYDSHLSGVRATIFGRNGATAADYAATDVGDPWSSDAVAFTTANPDLMVLALGTNDHASAVPKATFKSQITSYVTEAQASGSDVILVAPGRSNSGNAATWTDYRDALLEVAVAKACGLVDMAARWGDYATMSAAPYSYWADNDHQTAAGYAAQGAAVAAAIKVAAGEI